MNHEKWINLSVMEKIEFVGSVVHAIQNDSMAFDDAAVLINRAKERGAFEGVKINSRTEDVKQ